MPIRSRCLCVLYAAPLWMLLILSACVAGHSETDLSEVRIGMTQDELSAALHREPAEKGLRGDVQVYYYSIDRAYKMDPPPHLTNRPLDNPTIELEWQVFAYGLNTAQAYTNRQSSLLQVIFDDGGLSWSGRFSPNTSNPAGRQRMDKVAEAYGRLSNEEMRGEAAYELAVNAFPATIRNYWWCKSADSGYALGQNAVERYELDCPP